MTGSEYQTTKIERTDDLDWLSVLYRPSPVSCHQFTVIDDHG